MEDDVWSPGTPASATVTVTDNDELATVTVHPQQAFATERGPIRAIFRRTGGNISRPLVIDYLQFFLRNDAETDFGVFEHVTFAAGQAEVISSDFTAGTLPGDSIVNPGPASGDLYVPWTLTTVIYGDGGPNGFHRSWEAGIPNTASTVLYDDDVSQGLELQAQYSHRAAIGDLVSITFTVRNTGTAASGNPITITSVQRDDSSTTLDGQSDSRVGCTINRAIAVGASRSCTATFTIGQADFDTTPLELDATASDGTASSKPFRIYITILDGILVGFRETEPLQVTEAASSTADLVVTREGSLQEEVQVSYITRPFEGWNPGTAIEGDDYADRSATPGIITFGANEAEATISFDILQDGLFENRERFEVVLQAPNGVQVAADKGIRMVVILDFRSVNYRPVATLHRTGEGTVMEDSGSVEFAVRLNNASRQLLRYDVSLDPGVRGARAGSDFVDPTMTVALAPGELEQTFTVALIDDNKVEDPEDFRVRMTGHIRNPNPSWATLATPTTARVTIVDDDLVEPSEVRLALIWGRNNSRRLITEATSSEDITVTASFHTETPAGTSRTFVPFTEDTTVRVQFDDPASSADPTDFQAFGVLEVVIAAGETSGSSILQFRPVDDGIDEDTELITLAGSVVANSSVDSSLPVVPASFALADNDTRGITVTPGFVMNLMEEGDPGTYTVVLDSQPTDTVTIELQLDENGHLNVNTTTLTFNSTNWNVPQTVTVWAEDDGIIEVNQSESIEHEVSGGDYDQVTLGSVQVSIADITVAYIYLEGARALESSGHVEFTIRISPPQPTSSVAVQYSTADGTATGGSDYTSFNGSTLSIPAGQSSSTIRIPIANDTLDEADVETFTLRLTVPSNAKLAGDVAELTATGSIVDDDHTPVLTISGPDGSLSHVPEEAGVPVTFTLTLSGGSSEDVTLDYATGLARDDLGARSGQGTATAGEDYVAATGEVTFLPGEKTKTITVQVQDDHISEGTEFFGLNLSNLSNAEFTNQRTEEGASVGILDNDTRGVVISRSRIVLEEPRQGATATADSYTVVLTSQPTATATVSVDAASDPAVSLDTTSLTFTALTWNTPQTVTITPVRDADAVDEFVTVSHTVTGGDYEGLTADDVGVRVEDSDGRDVIVSPPTLPLMEGSNGTYTVELASQPLATTTVSITIAGDAQLTIDLTELTFTTSSWNTPQTITVTATEDDDVSDSTATLTHVASGSDYVSVTKTVSVTVTDDDEPAVNNLPTAADGTVATNEDVDHTFAAADFSYSDSDSDPLANVKITGLPAPGKGTLALDGTAIASTALPVTVTAPDLTANKLKYSPPANENGMSYASFTFKVNDGTADSAAYTMTINVTAVNDPATGTPTISGTAQVSQTLTASTAGIADPDGLPGTFTYQWKRYAANGTTSEANIGANSSTYTLTASEEGKKVLVEVSFTDNDGSDEGPLVSALYPSTQSQTVEADPLVNSPPAFSATTADRSVAENTAAGQDVGAVLTATDADSDTLTYTLEGADAASFDIVSGSGQIRTKTGVTYNHEAKSTYTVIVKADDGNGGTATVTVTIAVTDVDEPPGRPAAPSVSATAGSNTSLDVRWAPPSNTGPVITSYDLQYRQGTSGNFTDGPQDVTGASAAIGSLAPNTSYQVQVRATNAEGNGDWSLSGTGQTGTTVPGAPTGLTATASGTTQINLSWSAPASTGGSAITGYKIEVSSNGGSSWTDQVANTNSTATTYAHTGLAAGSTRHYRVSAINANGTGTASNVDSATTGTTVPGAPTGLTATASGTTQIDLSWGAPASDGGSAITGYKIEVSSNGGSSWTDQVANTNSTTTTYAHTGLAAGTTRHYRVSAINTNGTGTASNVANATTGQTTVTFGASSYTAAEGGATATVAVQLSAAASATVTIPLTKTHRGGATAADYSGVPSNVTFTAGQTRRTFTVTATDDADKDGGESVQLGFGTLPAGYAPGARRTATVTLVDDNADLIVNFGTERHTTVKVLESDTVWHRFIFSLSTRSWGPPNGNPQQPVTIPLVVTHRGGATPADYEVRGRRTLTSVTFGVGQSVTDFFMRAIPDGKREPGEGLRLDFGPLPPGVRQGDWGPYETIAFVDQVLPGYTVLFGAEAYTATEGGADALVSIHLNEPVEIEPVEVRLRVERVGGAMEADYTGIPKSVTFGVGDQTQTITVKATDDTDDDDGESVTLSFVNDPNGRVSTGNGPNSATVVLEDNDGPRRVTVSFGAATYTATEGGADATVRVELDAAPGRSVTVPLVVANQGGATAADYSVIPADVTFAANQTTTTFAVMATAGDGSDGGESVSIGFGTLPEGVFAGSPAATTVTLADGGEQRLVADFGSSRGHTVQVREGARRLRLNVLLNSSPRRPVTIPLVVTHVGGATAADYADIPESVTFAAGQTSSHYYMRALPDLMIETGEGLRIDFGPLPPGVTKGTWGPYETIEFVDP